MWRKLIVSAVVAVALVGVLAAAPTAQAHEPIPTSEKCMHGHHVYTVFFMPRCGCSEWRYGGTFRHRWMAEERAWELRSSGFVVRVESEWRHHQGGF